jgi:protein-S-isoprenylcysteine O-methyltransferase Ste14
MMQPLELRIPPPLAAALIAAAMWGLSSITARIDISTPARVIASAILAVMGIAIAFAGVVEFRRAQTTVSPLNPRAASRLVTSGIYRFTRNPMYLGLCVVLVAWAVFLSSGWALLGPLGFVFYITRFQIAPEERALASLFGNAFADYVAQVRRWI